MHHFGSGEQWNSEPTYPKHIKNGKQSTLILAYFSTTLLQHWRFLYSLGAPKLAGMKPFHSVHGSHTQARTALFPCALDQPSFYARPEAYARPNDWLRRSGYHRPI